MTTIREILSINSPGRIDLEGKLDKLANQLEQEEQQVQWLLTGQDMPPPTLWDMAQAEMAEQRYIRAILDGQLRRGAHRREYSDD